MHELSQNWPILALIITLVGTSWFNRSDMTTLRSDLNSLRADMNSGFRDTNARIDRLSSEVHQLGERVATIEGQNSIPRS
jgi:hypothetical protein